MRTLSCPYHKCHILFAFFCQPYTTSSHCILFSPSLALAFLRDFFCANRQKFDYHQPVVQSIEQLIVYLALCSLHVKEDSVDSKDSPWKLRQDTIDSPQTVLLPIQSYLFLSLNLFVVIFRFLSQVFLLVNLKQTESISILLYFDKIFNI